MKICLSCEGISATERERCSSCGTRLLPVDAVHYPLRRGEAEAANPLLGTVLDGKYRIQSVLGRGGMSTVFRAAHAVSLVPVALKLLHPRFGARQEFRRALLSEARKAGRVVHGSCARILDVGETEDGTAYLAMELAEGETLDRWVQTGVGLPPSVAVAVLVQVADALAAIHAAGLVHRDLSARNVMVHVRDGELVVKVLDFGIAKSAAMVARPGSSEPSGEPTGFANPVFAPPEYLAGADVDARADLYSFGVLAYLLLTGTLPVTDHDARAAAKATLAGRLLPLPAVPGAPRRLLRLVRQCLQLDPARRPGSAASVRDELLAVIAAARPVLNGPSVVAAVLAAVFAVLVWREAPEPYLSVGGSRLVLHASALPRGSEVQYLRSADLATLRCHFGGFDPRQLQVEIACDGVPLSRHRLDALVEDAGGALTLSTAQPGWRQALDGIVRASRDQELTLQFAVPGRALLGAALLRVDDDVPRIDTDLGGGEPGDDGIVLRQATKLVVRIHELTGVRAVELRVKTAAQSFSVPLPAAGGEVPVAQVLQEHFVGPGDYGAGTLQVAAEDLAGNQGEGPVLAFAHADLAAPEIIEVTGRRGEPAVPFAGTEAFAMLRLSAAEDDLTLTVTDADGRQQQPELQRIAGAPTDRLLTLVASGEHADDPFPAGRRKFDLRDRFGNCSSSYITLQFRSRRIDPVWQPVAGAAEPRGEVVGDTMVVAPAGGEFQFHCNDGYRPEHVLLRGHDGALAPDGERLLQLLDRRPGSARLLIAELAAGLYQVDLRVDAVAGEPAVARVPLLLHLRVLPEVVELHVPEVQSKFLQPLLAHALLQLVDGQLRDGSGWSYDPELRSLLRGRLWFGSDVLDPMPLPERIEGATALFPPVAPRKGRNVLALELRDVLGRPVHVLQGERPLPERRQNDIDLQVVADFYHDPEAPVLVGEDLRVEHGQEARLQLRSRLPFTDADRSSLRLGVAASELAADAVEPRSGNEVLLSFRIPFATWSLAANLNDLRREDYAKAQQATLNVYLDTPAWRWNLAVPLRTARTTLQPLRLDELRAPSARAALPPALAELTMVPVLAPYEPFVDPVPDSTAGRLLFRPQSAVTVRNLADFLLQDRETTRGQYLAAVDAFLQLPAAARPAWQRLVHADDPLGERRLQRAALLPAGTDTPADRPVVGIDFFQAWSWCALLGVVVAGDPELLRLPLGVELEVAAGNGGKVTAGNSPAARGKPVSAAGLRTAAARWLAGGGAPTAAECAAYGDVVGSTSALRPITGLDFGVREWVADLPRGSDATADSLLAEWSADYKEHLQHIAAFAAGARTRPEFSSWLRRFGVVRGLASCELEGWVDPASGQRFDAEQLTTLPAAVPGVVRTELVRRDGRDLLPGRADPRLLRIGFRTAGGQAFVARVRGGGP